MTNAVRHCIKRLVDCGLVNTQDRQSAILALREMESMVIGQVQIKELGLRNVKKQQKHNLNTRIKISEGLKKYNLQRVNDKLNENLQNG